MDTACNTGVFWRASARILMRRVPSRKRRKRVLGSRVKAKRRVMGEGEGKEKYAHRQSMSSCLKNAVRPRTESVIGAAWSE